MSDISYIQSEKNLKSQNEFYRNSKFFIGNIIQYQEDKDVYNFDKLCMIKIENADLLLACLGEKEYLNCLKNSLPKAYKRLAYKRLAYKRLGEKDISHILSAYFIDNSTFIIVGKFDIKEELFLKIIRDIYKKFQYVKLNRTDIPVVSRFAVVINQTDMFQRALEELCDERNSQKRFILSEACSNNKALKAKKELEMINIIYRAIQNNAVIPYYQGIYDSKKKCIEKYEALMRIKDLDGTIYYPNSFIDIAKKYNMYIRLSEMMIRRVFLEIDDKDMEVSVNLSVHDINSSYFRKTLFELLARRKSKKLLVFEILEDELFGDSDALKQFISETKAYGVKIAIDDFGSGYSNILEIPRISPHYIKIDGRIIRTLNESQNNRIILESIVYLSQKLNIQLVAEHVESIEIQKLIEKFSIGFSQGYYFSKPVPVEKIFNNQ